MSGFYQIACKLHTGEEFYVDTPNNPKKMTSAAKRKACEDSVSTMTFSEGPRATKEPDEKARNYEDLKKGSE